MEKEIELARQIAESNPVMGLAMLTSLITKAEGERENAKKRILADAYILRGKLLLSMGRELEAAEDAERAVTLNPDVTRSFSGSFQAEGRD